jgi:hypothetical protein
VIKSLLGATSNKKEEENFVGKEGFQNLGWPPAGFTTNLQIITDDLVTFGTGSSTSIGGSCRTSFPTFWEWSEDRYSLPANRAPLFHLNKNSLFQPRNF